MSDALIKQIHDAVKTGVIEEPFTVQDIQWWMEEKDIRKEDGTKYSKGYPASLLSDSVKKKKKTKNRNSKWLKQRKNENGKFEYWFAD